MGPEDYAADEEDGQVDEVIYDDIDSSRMLTGHSSPPFPPSSPPQDASSSRLALQNVFLPLLPASQGHLQDFRSMLGWICVRYWFSLSGCCREVRLFSLGGSFASVRLCCLLLLSCLFLTSTGWEWGLAPYSQIQTPHTFFPIPMEISKKTVHQAPRCQQKKRLPYHDRKGY